VAVNGTFRFGAWLANGASYAVTIASQPVGESCAVAADHGTVNGADVGVTVECTPNQYRIGGSVTGLQAGDAVVLQDNSSNSTRVTSDGAFTFPSSLASGASYQVSVLTPPSGQNCSVAQGSGIVGAADVGTVAVTCAGDGANLGGTVSGLLAGTSVALQNNGTDSLSATNGPFTFNAVVALGAAYAVSLASQPVGQSCTLQNASGTMGGNPVSNVAVACTQNPYHVGGAVSGLMAGSSVTLQDNGANATTVSSNAPFVFPALLSSGAGYAVTVTTQPQGQTCAVTNGSGVIGGTDIGNVAVACTDNLYNVSVTVSGLIGTGLILQNSGHDNLAVAVNGVMNFATPVASGQHFAVTVATQPQGQQCSVAAGTGTIATGNVNVGVSCARVPDLWTWQAGSNLANAAGVYGTKGSAAAGNVPGARHRSVAWKDAAGNPWLFGGYGFDGTGSAAVLNDLWEYTGGQWIWMSGSSQAAANGNYGTLGSGAGSSAPGARYEASAWSDASGNFWLFGGVGFDANGAYGSLNDLWEYTGGQWIWVGGSKTVGAPGSYGTQGTAAPGNVPGARYAAASWSDASGDLWVFGGYGMDSTGTAGDLNDLWKYSSGHWTWMGGSNTAAASGTYGALGVAATGNTPGARYAASTWIDASGNFWLFGGYGVDSSGALGGLNDLWEFSAGQWSWISGSNLVNSPATYGTQGVAAVGNVPGARQFAMSWLDALGNLWLLGGYGLDSTGVYGDINDVWLYSAGEWTWVHGASTVNASGTYGMQGAPAVSSAPGARYGGVSWADAAGNLWLYGGNGVDSAGSNGPLNDLWQFTP